MNNKNTENKNSAHTLQETTINISMQEVLEYLKEWGESILKFGTVFFKKWRL
jgi:chromatin segregation and condensation protein Rec8/ScpA/Scc1 (kleisin family)